MRSRRTPSKRSTSKAAVALSSSVRRKKPYVRSRTVWNKLDGYQRVAVRFAVDIQTSALLFEQGTGKTYIAGGILEELANEDLELFQALFVVSLTNKESTWMTFFHENLPQVHVATSVEQFATLPRPRVLLTHYEQLTSLVDAYPKFFKAKRRWHLVVYDESQRIKAHNSDASKAASKIRHSGVHKVILTGTPMDSEPQDLWAQMRFVNDEVLGTSWKAFEDEWFEPLETPDFKKIKRGSWKWHKVMRDWMIKRRQRKFDASKRNKLARILKPWCWRVTKEDVLDLPPLRYKYHRVDMLGEQRRRYDELKNELVSRRINTTAPLKVTQLVKLQQITGGFVKDDGGEVRHVGRAKLRRLATLLRGLRGEQVAIFAKYRAEIDGIVSEVKKLTASVDSITGKTRKPDRAKIVQAFQDRGLQVVVCQIKTGGVGIDLFRACHGVVYSPTYSHIDFDQCVSRLHRRGQVREVTFHLLCANRSVDEQVFQALVMKRRVTTAVLNQLKRTRSNERQESQSRQARRQGVQVRRGGSRQEDGHPARQRPRRAA